MRKKKNIKKTYFNCVNTLMVIKQSYLQVHCRIIQHDIEFKCVVTYKIAITISYRAETHA